MKAAILAAGCATRLRPYTEDTPKTLLPVGGVPILRRTITTLKALGFDEFVIGTGYLEHLVRDAVASWFPSLAVTFVTNPVFRDTNNAYSLALLRRHVEGSAFLLIDGDVVFDREVVQAMLARGPDCLALRSTGSLGAEEMKVAQNSAGKVLAISKHVPVSQAAGESVGIELFSAATSRALFAMLEHRMAVLGLVNEYYEASFQAIVEAGAELYSVDITGHYATEIDTIEDLIAANDRVAGRSSEERELPVIRLAI